MVGAVSVRDRSDVDRGRLTTGNVPESGVDPVTSSPHALDGQLARHCWAIGRVSAQT